MAYGGHISLAWYQPFPGSTLWDQRRELGLPIDEGLYDDPDYNWRQDPDLFRRIRPRMTWDDCMAVEEVIRSLVVLDPKYLQYRQFEEVW
jgi:hypothetical protein